MYNQLICSSCDLLRYMSVKIAVNIMWYYSFDMGGNASILSDTVMCKTRFFSLFIFCKRAEY